MSRRAAVNEKQGRHSSHFALVRFAMMTTCLDLAVELLSALIAGHEERAEVREERRGAGGHVKALGGSALATPSRWPRWSRAITHRVQSICSRHHHSMSLFRKGGSRRREGREFSEGGTARGTSFQSGLAEPKTRTGNGRLSLRPASPGIKH